MVKAFGVITTGHDVIYPRYDPQKFVGRGWLLREATRFRTSTDSRHLIIVGEPGSGKSAFLAYLAETWNCPRHFIRSDNLGGVTGVDPRSFLISLGSQLYQKYGPDIFDRALSRTTNVTVGITQDKAEVVGRLIEEYYSLPFLPQAHSEVTVDVQAAIGESRVVGERIKKLVDITHALELPTLLHVTVINPLKKLQEHFPDEKVVILVDALDESLQHRGTQIPAILPRTLDQDFPANLQFISTSRRGDHLNDFHAVEWLYLDDKEKGYWQNSQRDTRHYLINRLKAAPLANIITTWSRAAIRSYVTRIHNSSEANFLYLYHYFNELLEAVTRGETDLNNFFLPKGLDEIYRHFAVAKIRRNIQDVIHFATTSPLPAELLTRWRQVEGVEQVQVSDKHVMVIAENSDKVILKLSKVASQAGVDIDDESVEVQKGTDVGIWETKYLPLLGILAVAYESLTREQLSTFAGVELVFVDTIVNQLQQFMDVDEQTSRYQLYHTSFREFLLDRTRNREYTLDGPTYHYQIAVYYRGEQMDWSEVNWMVVSDLYAFHYLALHLAAAAKNEELYALINKGWMDAQFKRTHSYTTFSSNVELAVAIAEAETPPNLLQIVRNSLIYAAVGSLAANIPAVALKVLTELGQQERAEGYAMQLTSAKKRCDAFCQIGLALSQQGKPSEARVSFGRAVKAAKSIDELNSSAMQLADVIEVLAQIEEDQQAEEVANQAMELISKMSDAEQRSRTLVKVASAFAQAGLIDLVFTAFEKSTSYEGRISVIIELLRALVKRGNVKVAVQLVHFVTDDPDRKCLLEVGLVQALTQTGRMTQAREIVEQLPILVEPVTDLLLKPLLLAQIARAFAWVRENARAIELIDQAINLSKAITTLPERSWVLASVSKSLAQIGLANPALQLAESIAESNADPSSLRAKGEALAEVAKSLALTGNYEQALALSITAEVLKQSGPYTVTVEYVLPDEMIQGQYDKIRQRVEQNYGGPPAFAEVVRIVAEAGLIEQARATATGIPDLSKRHKALYEIATAQIRAGNMEEAFATIELINNSIDKAEILAKISEFLVSIGRRKQAEEVVERAIAQTKTVFDRWSETKPVGEIVKVLAQAKQVERALAVTEVMTKGQAMALVIVAESLIETEKYQQAGLLIERAITIANQTAQWTEDMVRDTERSQYGRLSSYLNGSLLLKVVMMLFRLGRTQQAIEVVNQVVASVSSSRAFIREGMLAQGVTALARIGQVDYAHFLGRKMVGSWFALPALAELIKALFNIGESELARQLTTSAVTNIQSMSEDQSPTSEFITILAEGGFVDQILVMIKDDQRSWADTRAEAEVARALGREGRIADALEVANHVAMKVEKALDRSIMAEDLAEVISALAPVGKCDLAMRLADRAMNATREVDHLPHRAMAQARVAQALAELGEVDQALGIAEEITDLKYTDFARAKSLALRSIAQAFLKTGLRERAVEITFEIAKIAEAIMDTSDKASLLITALTILVSAEKTEQALSFLRTALSFARSSNPSDFFDTLHAALPFLAAIDQCRTLWNIHQALLEIDRWWSTYSEVPKSSEDSLSYKSVPYSWIYRYLIY